MLSGNIEGYTKVQCKNTYTLPCDASAMLFLQLCLAIDIVRNQEYRYGYDLEKSGKAKSGDQNWKVTVMDIGE